MIKLLTSICGPGLSINHHQATLAGMGQVMGAVTVGAQPAKGMAQALPVQGTEGPVGAMQGGTGRGPQQAMGEPHKATVGVEEVLMRVMEVKRQQPGTPRQHMGGNPRTRLTTKPVTGAIEASKPLKAAPTGVTALIK